jgi:hypothetical protein
MNNERIHEFEVLYQGATSVAPQEAPEMFWGFSPAEILS